MTEAQGANGVIRKRRAEQLAQAVKNRRDQLGINVTEAARRAGLSWPTWQRLESGKQDTFKPATVKAVAKALQWPNDWLVLLRSNKTPDVLAELPGSDSVLRELAHDLVDRMSESQLKQLVFYVVGDAVVMQSRLANDPAVIETATVLPLPEGNANG